MWPRSEVTIDGILAIFSFCVRFASRDVFGLGQRSGRLVVYRHFASYSFQHSPRLQKWLLLALMKAYLLKCVYGYDRKSVNISV